MAVTMGTSAGFVTASPSADPDGSLGSINDRAWAVKDVSDATASKVTEIGWYCGYADSGTTVTVGIYEHNAGDDEPEALVGSATFTSSGAAGWQKKTGLDISISPSTTYWIAVQVDTGGNQWIDWSSGSERRARRLSQTSLPDPWGTTDYFSTSPSAVYAVWEASAGTNAQINIGDSWKTVDGLQINIGDAWKTVAGVQINIGDTWKEVFS